MFFIVAIILFAYLIHYISKSIQINIYIQNLSKETNLLIEKKDNIIKKDGRISKNTLDSLEKLSNMPSIDIKTERSGFIQFYDEEKLYEYAKKNDVLIWCEKKLETMF